MDPDHVVALGLGVLGLAIAVAGYAHGDAWCEWVRSLRRQDVPDALLLARAASLVRSAREFGRVSAAGVHVVRRPAGHHGYVVYGPGLGDRAQVVEVDDEVEAQVEAARRLQLAGWRP